MQRRGDSSHVLPLVCRGAAMLGASGVCHGAVMLAPQVICNTFSVFNDKLAPLGVGVYIG